QCDSHVRFCDESTTLRHKPVAVCVIHRRAMDKFVRQSQASAEQIWRRAGTTPYCGTLGETQETFVAPNPEELDKATFTGRQCALGGTRSIAVPTEGLSRLMVGGTTPSRIANRQKIASTAPAAPSR